MRKIITDKPFPHRRAVVLTGAAVFLAALFLAFLGVCERTAATRTGSLARLEVKQYYEVRMGGKAVFFFSTLRDDSTFQDITFSQDSIRCIPIRTVGRFRNRWSPLPSCRGRIASRQLPSPTTIDVARVGQAIVRREAEALDSILKTLDRENDELTYYLRVHGVQDEGYNMIARYHGHVDSSYHRYKRLKALLDKRTGTPVILLRRDYTAVFRNDSGKLVREPCTVKGVKDGMVRLQLASKATPSTVRLYAWPWENSAPARREKRNGWFESQDTLGRRVHGWFEGDTLVRGIRFDSAGVYTGQLDRYGIANGHGRYEGSDGSYYEGQWKDDMRQHFGFSTTPNSYLRVGEWKKDVYKGERLTYNSDRIYGIDISKYQHEVKRKKYAIDWSSLRITHLGTQSKKRVKGNVDYPVQFVFIKSTEGTTVRNKWYAADYRNARAHGKHVGAYHFFSLRSRGSDQARYFLRNSHFNKGDLPPVLDVECFPSQIRKVGADVMWTNIRAFLRLVEEHTGTKPIIYTNQTFVNRYLPMVPDIVRDYQIWIARYGEYKPEIRLAIWQLSQDGRVKGIHGAVDINVFNGYADEYKEFLQTKVIP